MNQEITVTRARATTPRAAAIAGILFSLLLLTSLTLIRLSVPENPQDAGTWLSGDWKTISIALNLLPFAGVAFLWFIGVVRDRLGEHEDRFFATVFLGSGLLFLAMLFAVPLLGERLDALSIGFALAVVASVLASRRLSRPATHSRSD